MFKAENSVWVPDVCLYHYPCADGLAAAWSVWLRWPDVEFIGVNYGKPPPEGLVGRKVLIVDFSYPAAVLEEIEAHSVVVLDHHKTGEADLASVVWPGIDMQELRNAIARAQPNEILAWFDMEKAGCRLAWEFCHGGEPLMDLLEYVEDRDLWRFKHGDMTRKVGAYLRSIPLTIESWDRAIRSWAVDRRPILAKGEGVLGFLEQRVAEAVDGGDAFQEIGGHIVQVRNVPPWMSSETCHALLEKYPDILFAVCYSEWKGVRTYQLRSRKDGFDVSAVAREMQDSGRALTGGGHQAAAGFKVRIKEFDYAN